MKITTTLIFALLFVTSSLGGTQAAALRSNIVVGSEFVRLGDLFTDAGADAEAIVAGAPAPGRKKMFRAEKLHAIAREHGLDWSPKDLYDRVTVERAGRAIERGEIEDRVTQALITVGLPEEHEVELANRTLTVFAATDQAEPYRIRNARYDRRTGRFAAVLELPTGARSAERVQLTGRVYRMIEVPVLARRVRRGEVIGTDDVVLARLRADAVGRTAILDPARVVGKTPRRLMREGVPLRPGDLRRPTVVVKGALVTLVLRTRRMILTAKGRAAHNAAMGDVVRVVNTRSNNTVEGVVVGRDRVTVSLSDPIR